MPPVIFPVTFNGDTTLPERLMLVVLTLAPAILAVTVSAPSTDPVKLMLATLSSAAFTLPTAVTLPTDAAPVALINPVVIKLPLVTFAVTSNELSVPTDVIFGCAAVVTVPAVVAEVAEPAVSA